MKRSRSLPLLEEVEEQESPERKRNKVRDVGSRSNPISPFGSLDFSFLFNPESLNSLTSLFENIRMAAPAGTYNRWNDELTAMACGLWWNPRDLVALRRGLVTVNFSITSARQEAIASIQTFIGKGQMLMVNKLVRFPEATIVISETDDWYQNLTRIIGALSYKNGDKDVKKIGKEAAGGARTVEEIDVGNFSDSHKAYLSCMSSLIRPVVYTRETFEERMGLSWMVNPAQPNAPAGSPAGV